jgi:nitrogen regulatory protein PII 2
MREIMCFIRMNKVNDTKRALAEHGFPAFTCRKCLGRGKKSIDPELLNAVIAAGEMPMSSVGENLTESARLIAKRFFTLVVDDKDVKKAVEVIIAANQTGNPGDGKIFVLPIMETFSVRTGEGHTEISKGGA